MKKGVIILAVFAVVNAVIVVARIATDTWNAIAWTNLAAFVFCTYTAVDIWRKDRMYRAEADALSRKHDEWMRSRGYL